MSRSIRALVLVALLAGALPAVPEEDDSISVTLRWTRGDPSSYREGNLRLRHDPPDGLVAPPGLKSARYARLGSGTGLQVDIVFVPFPSPMRIWVDTDFDGDLADEQPVVFSDEEYESTADVVLRRPDSKERIPLRFVAFLADRMPVVTVAVLAHLEGEVVLEGRLRRIAAWDGDSDLAFASPSFDTRALDLDGDCELAREDESEWIDPGRPFRVGDGGYLVELVDDSPERLRIRPSASVPPSRRRSWKALETETPGRQRRRTTDLTAERVAKIWKEACAGDKSWGPDTTWERESAIKKLSSAGTREALLALVGIARSEKNEELRVAAIEGTGYNVYAPWAGPVGDLAVKARSPATRIAAIRALHGMAAPERIETYSEVLEKDKDDDVAASAARHAAFAGTLESRKALTRIVAKGRRRENRHHAYVALTRYAPRAPSTSQVRSALDQKEPRLQAIGLTDALFLRFADCRDLAMALAKPAGKCPDLAAAVVEVLGRECNPDALDALLGLAPAVESTFAAARFPAAAGRWTPAVVTRERAATAARARWWMCPRRISTSCSS